jgi:hypothetical protein
MKKTPNQEAKKDKDQFKKTKKYIKCEGGKET